MGALISEGGLEGGLPFLTVLTLVLMLMNSLAATQDPVPASHFSQDVLRPWVEKFLIIMLDNEFGYGMFWVQYNWMDIVMVKGLCSSKSASHYD